jgi:hypothetical protein
MRILEKVRLGSPVLQQEKRLVEEEERRTKTGRKGRRSAYHNYYLR